MAGEAGDAGVGRRLEHRSVHGDRGVQGRARWRVLAAEPDRGLVGLLERTQRLPLPQEVRFELAAVTIPSEWEPVPLNVDRRGPASNWIGEGPGGSQSGGSRETRAVPPPVRSTTSCEGTLPRIW